MCPTRIIQLGQAGGIQYDELALHLVQELQIALSLKIGKDTRDRLDGESEIVRNIAAGHWKIDDIC